MCVGASRVFKLTSELKQGSCLLELLRKIYLYLQFDAFNPVRAQVTVQWVHKEGERAGARVRNVLQHTTAVLNMTYNLMICVRLYREQVLCIYIIILAGKN